jgi:hypothetical protein
MTNAREERTSADDTFSSILLTSYKRKKKPWINNLVINNFYINYVHKLSRFIRVTIVTYLHLSTFVRSSTERN